MTPARDRNRRIRCAVCGRAFWDRPWFVDPTLRAPRTFRFRLAPGDRAHAAGKVVPLEISATFPSGAIVCGLHTDDEQPLVHERMRAICADYFDSFGGVTVVFLVPGP